MNKNLFAITINQNHEIYDQDIKLVQANISLHTTSNYVLLVKHGLTKTEHYHALIQTMYSFNYLKNKKIFHIEPVRNPEAYKKYMINHDLVEKNEIGELEFHEQDKLLDYCILHGPTATVQKFGMLALKYYKSLKEYYNDYQVNIDYLKYLNSYVDISTKGENENER
jgi:hypothetical protein